MYAKVGKELGFLERYSTCINRHLYNINGTQLPLAIDEACLWTAKILEGGIQGKWTYTPALFKNRQEYNFSANALCNCCKRLSVSKCFVSALLTFFQQFREDLHSAYLAYGWCLVLGQNQSCCSAHQTPAHPGEIEDKCEQGFCNAK